MCLNSSGLYTVNDGIFFLELYGVIYEGHTSIIGFYVQLTAE